MKTFDVYSINDINIVRAKGCYLWDENDVQYLDMYGGHAVISIGHTHPHWVKRIEEQLHEIAFYSNSIKIPIQQELAEKLGKTSGKDNFQLFLCNSGAEANENALKLASFHTGRKKIIAFSKSFHGRTSLAVAATDNPAIIAPVNETTNIVFLPYNDGDTLKEYFEKHGEEVAAVIVEPIQGVGGITIATESFLQSIRKSCNENGALFIADEVQCGYGRSGKFFCLDHAKVDADIYSMAKGMGNGFPVGGILIAPFIQPKLGMLGTTFGGNHLACAAAIAVLEIIKQDDLMEKANQLGEYVMNELKKFEGLQNIRGKGLMIGFDVAGELKELRNYLLKKHKVFTGEAKPDVIRLLPSLSISQKQLDEFLEIMKAALKELTVQPVKVNVV